MLLFIVPSINQLFICVCDNDEIFQQLMFFSRIAFRGCLVHHLDTGRKLNVHKMFKRRPGRLPDVLRTLNFPRKIGRQKLVFFELVICYIYLKQGCNISNLALPEVRKLVDGDGRPMKKECFLALSWVNYY